MKFLHRVMKRRSPLAMAFINFDNWYYAYQKHYHIKPDVENLHDFFSTRNNLTKMFVYGHFCEKLAPEVERIAQIEVSQIINIQNSRHSAVEFKMLDSIYQTAMSDNCPDTFIIFANDDFLLPVIQHLVRMKKRTILCAVPGTISENLENSASEVVMFPFTETAMQSYIKMIIDNFDYILSSKTDIIPTFWSTVEKVAKHYQVPQIKIQAALAYLIEKEYIKQELRHVDFNRRVKALRPDWTALIRDGYCDVELI